MWTSRQYALTLAAVILAISIFTVGCGFRSASMAAGAFTGPKARFIHTVSRQHYDEVIIPVRAPLATCMQVADEPSRCAPANSKIGSWRGAVVGLVRGYSDFEGYGKEEG